MWNQKQKQKQKRTHKTQTHRYREQIGGWQKQGVGKVSKMGEGGQNKFPVIR